MNKGGNRDDLPTLRVTNLSEDCTDKDMWDLFDRFGRINRCVCGDATRCSEEGGPIVRPRGLSLLSAICTSLKRAVH